MAKKKRYKTKLKKYVKRFDDKGQELPYYTKIEDCKKWFNIINQEMFRSKLPLVEDWDIRWRRRVWAWYACDYNKTGELVCQILMNKKYKSKKFFLEVLGHEMVHHWQAHSNAPIGHGQCFKEWKESFKKRGLKI